MVFPRKPELSEEQFLRGAPIKEEVEEERKEYKTFPIKLPWELWKKLKLKAIEEEMTMQKLIVRILERAVK